MQRGDRDPDLESGTNVPDLEPGTNVPDLESGTNVFPLSAKDSKRILFVSKLKLKCSYSEL